MLPLNKYLDEMMPRVRQYLDDLATETTVPVPDKVWDEPSVQPPLTAETSRVVEAPRMIWEELAIEPAAPSFKVPPWTLVTPE